MAKYRSPRKRTMNQPIRASGIPPSPMAGEPKYVDAPVRAMGSDPYDLDRDGDGVGCDPQSLALQRGDSGSRTWGVLVADDRAVFGFRLARLGIRPRSRAAFLKGCPSWKKILGTRSARNRRTQGQPR
jgi:hypothetical protein